MWKVLDSLVASLFAILAILNLLEGIYYTSNLILLYGAYKGFLGVILMVLFILWDRLERW